MGVVVQFCDLAHQSVMTAETKQNVVCKTRKGSLCSMQTVKTQISKCIYSLI